MYDRILIVLDERTVTRTAVREGLALARVHGAELLFFTVLPNYVIPVADMPPITMESPTEFDRAARGRADRLLKSALAKARRLGVPARGQVGSGDDDADCIVDAARRERCDLIVVASEGRNAVMRLLGGSVIPGLVTAAPVPVLVCKARPRAPAGAAAVVTPAAGAAAPGA